MTTEVVNRETPSELITLAIEKGADLDKLEKLLSLKERYEANEARKAYHEAMTKFKANAPKILKDKAVSFGQGKTSYKHASLGQVTEKVAAEMSKHGLSASWRVNQESSIAVTTRVAHVLGHFEETTLKAMPDDSGAKNSIQAIGSTISYLERYGLLAICGLATYDQDNDGNSVVSECIDNKQLSQIMDYVADREVDVQKFCSYMGIESIEKMPKSKFQQAITALQNKKKGGK